MAKPFKGRPGRLAYHRVRQWANLVIHVANASLTRQFG
jgi:hypothetical protein